MHKSFKLWHILFLSFAFVSPSQTLLWNRNTEADLAGYKVYTGKESGKYQFANSVKDEKFSLAGFSGVWFFAVTAIDTAGNESAYSSEVVYTTQTAPRPIAPSIVTVKGRSDSILVSDGDTLVVAFTAINKLDDGTIIPEALLKYQVWYRAAGGTWIKVLTNPAAVTEAGKIFLTIPFYSGLRAEFVVTTYYGDVESKAPKSVIVKVAEGAQWKTYQLKVII